MEIYFESKRFATQAKPNRLFLLLKRQVVGNFGAHRYRGLKPHDVRARNDPEIDAD